MPAKISLFFRRIKDTFGFITHEGKHRVWVFLVQLFVVICAGTAILLFMGSSLAQSAQKIIKTRESIVAYQERIGGISLLKQSYQQVQDHLPNLYALLVTVDDLGGVVSKLDQLADHFALKTSTKIKDSGQENESKTVILTITTNGNFDTIQRYLFALEELPFLAQVKSFQFNGPFNQNAGATVQLAVFIK